MEYNLRDAVLCPALHWDTDIVSVGERHAQARAAAEFRSYHGGWAQAGGSANLEPMICCLIAAVGHRRRTQQNWNP